MTVVEDDVDVEVDVETDSDTETDTDTTDTDSETDAGTDAMHTDPDYSAAYVILRTDAALDGHGLTFTIGRGNEVCARAIEAYRPLVVGRSLTEIAGEAGLSTRPIDGEGLESARLKAKLGEMLLERELLEAKIAALEARDPGPLARRRPRP